MRRLFKAVHHLDQHREEAHEMLYDYCITGGGRRCIGEMLVIVTSIYQSDLSNVRVGELPRGTLFMDLRLKCLRISPLSFAQLTLETTATYFPKVHLKSVETAKFSDKHAESTSLHP
jgi:hypothetical protein